MLDHGVILSVPINPSLELAIFYASNLTWERSPFICVLRQIGNIKIHKKAVCCDFQSPFADIFSFQINKRQNFKLIIQNNDKGTISRVVGKGAFVHISHPPRDTFMGFL